jgi:CubicO group peptidase (beta-lactamase class C family)
VAPVAAIIVLSPYAAAQTTPPPAPGEPTPKTVEEFQAAAARVLQGTGVPGAGIALVRLDGVEWEGGIGYADRERQTPVTTDTHFRVGSISKTFVAMALVQLAEDGVVDLEGTVDEIAPEIAIDNPWHHTDPVRVVHLLQHTSGFDDMHFTDRYVPDGMPELSLEAVLQLNPQSRRVRWRPGTRMAYSNPGYGLAGYLIEKLTGEPYEDYIKREIFDPLEMTTSSFRLTADDEPLLARGYEGSAGPPVGFPQIYLRPAGNMHSSPRELGRFVRMLLGWGELGAAFVVDPEYLGNMELPRTTLASQAGVRHGYGSGIATIMNLPYLVLGHGGGIDGFSSIYGYSPSRDVGYVILLNSVGSGAPDAMNRLSSLAIRYLKRDVAPPSAPETRVDAAMLDQHAGYYHDANPRNQIFWGIQSLLAGRTIARDGEALYSTNLLGARERLIPVTNTAFRLANELDASLVFTRDVDGTAVLAGPRVYAERRPRWRVEIVRLSVAAALLAIASVLPIAVVWVARVRRARPRGFWGLKMAMLACPLVLLSPAVALVLTPSRAWGVVNGGTLAVFVASLGVPALAGLVTALALAARRAGASRLLVVYALVIAYAMAGTTVYLAAHDLIGLRMWRY